MTTGTAFGVFGVPVIGLLSIVLTWGIRRLIKKARAADAKQTQLNDQARANIVQARIENDHRISEIAAGVDDARAGELLSEPPRLPKPASPVTADVRKNNSRKVRGVRGR